jgi:hypothetical protein
MGTWHGSRLPTKHISQDQSRPCIMFSLIDDFDFVVLSIFGFNVFVMGDIHIFVTRDFNVWDVFVIGFHILVMQDFHVFDSFHIFVIFVIFVIHSCHGRVVHIRVLVIVVAAVGVVAVIVGFAITDGSGIIAGIGEKVVVLIRKK